MKKPIIGITCIHTKSKGKMVNELNDFYIEAIVRAGGVPFIIPTMIDDETISEYTKILDGILFTGGHDVWPLKFGEEPVKEIVEITYQRDEMELELFKKAYEVDIPVLGVCRGLQVFNIGLGGTLYQDIYSQVENVGGHTFGYNTEELYHSIHIVEGTIMKEIYGKETVLVNSEHHQAIKDLGKDLKVTSRSKDGIIESIESTNDKFVFALQYHPEAIAGKYSEHQEIFNYFIKRCL